MLFYPQLQEDAPWKRRFRADSLLWAAIAQDHAEHGLVCTNKDGAYQLYGWHVPSGQLHRLTGSATGVVQGMLSADGRSVYYHQDLYGNEIGHYVRVDFAGGEAASITPDLPPYASFHIAQSRNGSVTGFMAAGQDGFKIYTLAAGEPLQTLLHSSQLALGPYLSADGEIAVVRVLQASGSLDTRLVAYARASQQVMAEFGGGTGASISPGPFSPLEGDPRMAVANSETGFDRPAIWNVVTSECRKLAVEAIAGNITVVDWSPDASRLLLSQLYQARYRLYVYNLEEDTVAPLMHPEGVISQSFFAPSGEIYAVWQDSTLPSRLIALDQRTGGRTRTGLGGSEVPAGHKFWPATFESSEGGVIQAWLATPDSDGPYPTIVHAHGGPVDVMTELFSPVAQGWVDHGFAYCSVNYRGSTTFGKAFEKAIWGRLGTCEVNDIADACAWLVAEGIADSQRLFMVGGSYGGYLTLLTAGKRPDLLAGGVAVAAIADWTMMVEDAAETLHSYFQALLGGPPAERHEAYRDGSPLTYVEDVQCPLLIIQGRNDTRCPPRQMEVYFERLQALGKDAEIEWFDAGHGLFVREQQIDHFARMLQFVHRVLARASN
ncbi:MAG: prolyl oligopeptidase family serine peptidase [Anaerolineae bacterium]|nr:prolyl oligopeptidase family serine peptidase [Anaerolineae bacterium]